MAEISVNRPFDFKDRELLLAKLKRIIEGRSNLNPPHRAPRETQQMCLLAGTPGIGKTRALAELETHLGIPVLFATFGNGTPYKPDEDDDQNIELATAQRLLDSVAAPVSGGEDHYAAIRANFRALTLNSVVALWAKNNPQKAERGLVILAIDEVQRLPAMKVRGCFVPLYGICA